jgi:hypothetical protein
MDLFFTLAPPFTKGWYQCRSKATARIRIFDPRPKRVSEEERREFMRNDAQLHSHSGVPGPKPLSQEAPINASSCFVGKGTGNGEDRNAALTVTEKA